MKKIIMILVAFPMSLFASVQQVNFELTKTAVAELNALPTVQNLIELADITLEAKELLKNEVGIGNLAKKILFTSDKDSVLIQFGEKKISVKFKNPAKGKYLVAGYPVELFGKTSLEKLVYLKKVIQSQSGSKKATTLLSLIEPVAFADDKNLQSLSAAELTALGISVTRLAEVSRQKSCELIRDEKTRQKKLKYFILIIDTIAPLYKPVSEEDRRADKEEQAQSNPEFLQLSEQFWCSPQPARISDEFILGFNAICDMKSGHVTTVNYVSARGVGTIKSEKQPELEKLIAQRFDEKFKTKLVACCANSTCRNQVNEAAPMASRSSPDDINKKIQNKIANPSPSGKQ